jgi:hypothetical protein
VTSSTATVTSSIMQTRDKSQSWLDNNLDPASDDGDKSAWRANLSTTWAYFVFMRMSVGKRKGGRTLFWQIKKMRYRNSPPSGRPLRWFVELAQWVGYFWAYSARFLLLICLTECSASETMQLLVCWFRGIGLAFARIYDKRSSRLWVGRVDCLENV